MKINKNHLLVSIIIFEVIIVVSGMLYLSEKNKIPSVLVIDIHGEIVSAIHPGGINPDKDSIKVIAEDIIKILRKYENDNTIKAFIFDIDSNGGNFGDSELVRELQQIKKPIVSVVRDQALSGGYYVASITDRIFANELSNIADIGYTQVIEYDPLGNGQYVKCHVASSEFKRMYYDDCPGFDSSRLYIEEIIRLRDATKFMALEIAKYRNLPENHVLTLSDGTIFSGIGALKLGLIDEIGGLHEAVDWLEKELGMELNIIYLKELKDG